MFHTRGIECEAGGDEPNEGRQSHGPGDEAAGEE